MIFITENLNLNVPSKDNLVQWSEWVNSANLKKTVLSLIPKTRKCNGTGQKMSLYLKNLLEICDKTNNF